MKILKNSYPLINHLKIKQFLIDNYDWLSNLNFNKFFKANRSKFSVNKMLSLESIKAKIKKRTKSKFSGV